MARREPSAVIRDIIKKLKKEPLSLRALDIKVNTSDKSIKDYTLLLQDLGIVQLTKLKKGKKTITKVELTSSGRKVKV